ncbi:MAG: hypothetical protein R3B51_11405 [Thermodesulfobacteriota bacterium]
MRFILGDLTEAFGAGSFDIVVSNPPYVSPAEYESLDPTVKDYEPGLALVSGEDGLSHIKRIIRDSSRILRKAAGAWSRRDTRNQPASRHFTKRRDSGIFHRLRIFPASRG